MGYFATTGLAAIDQVIADPWTASASIDAQFVERLWRLPATRLCFTPPGDAPPATPLPALIHGHITFGCFNKLSKMNEAVVALWSRILAAVPGSRLMLKAGPLAEASTRQAVAARFAAYGIAAERLVLESLSGHAAYLSAFGQIDMALDPFPFSGGTTSVEGMWMGVPPLTLAGDRFVGRQGVSLLMNLGLSDWVGE